jgi:type III restriction enzyme
MKCTEIDLLNLEKHLRLQNIIFETSGQVYDLMKSSWKQEATKLVMIGQIIRLVEQYVHSGAVEINPPSSYANTLRRLIILMMNMNLIVQHLWNYIEFQQTDCLIPVLDLNKKIKSTADMPTWYTSRPCSITSHSHISHCVFDSTWEATESYALEKNPNVAAWVKNDHLGFEIVYVFDGIVRKYYPDFLVRLKNGKMIVLETKGQISRQSESKRKALQNWVDAVNNLDQFGK